MDLEEDFDLEKDQKEEEDDEEEDPLWNDVDIEEIKKEAPSS